MEWWYPRATLWKYEYEVHPKEKEKEKGKKEKKKHFSRWVLYIFAPFIFRAFENSVVNFFLSPFARHRDVLGVSE